MLKQTITYTNFNDQKVTKELYFNISKTELLENMHLRDRFESLEQNLSGAERQLTVEEIKEIVNLVKLYMRIGYGERSEDGELFEKSDEIWRKFSQSAAHDAFLWSLFEDPMKAISFLLGLLPKDLRDQAEANARAQHPEWFTSDNVFTPDIPQPEALPEAPMPVAPTPEVIPGPPSDEAVLEDNRPDWEKEDRDPTDQELLGMDRDELMRAMKRKNDKKIKSQ